MTQLFLDFTTKKQTEIEKERRIAKLERRIAKIAREIDTKTEFFKNGDNFRATLYLQGMPIIVGFEKINDIKLITLVLEEKLNCRFLVMYLQEWNGDKFGIASDDIREDIEWWLMRRNQRLLARVAI